MALTASPGSLVVLSAGSFSGVRSGISPLPATLVPTPSLRGLPGSLQPWALLRLPNRRRHLSDFLVCSNLTYAAIAAVYAHKGLPVRSAMLALAGATSFAYHFSGESFAGHIDQVAASGAFLATATLLPLVSFDVQLLEGLLVLLALVAKYVMQESREESLQAGHDFWYWLPHCLWHLLVTMGQALLAASIPYFV